MGTLLFFTRELFAEKTEASFLRSSSFRGAARLRPRSPCRWRAGRRGRRCGRSGGPRSRGRCGRRGRGSPRARRARRGSCGRGSGPARRPRRRRGRSTRSGGIGEGLVHPADPPRVDALGALVGDGREVIAVEDDDLAGREGGLEVLLDVLAPVLDEEGELLLGRQRIGPGRQPLDLPPPPAPRRLAEEGGLPAPPAEPPEKGPGLGRFAGAVDPFEDDEEAAAALAGHGRSS